MFFNIFYLLIICGILLISFERIVSQSATGTYTFLPQVAFEYDTDPLLKITSNIKYDSTDVGTINWINNPDGTFSYFAKYQLGSFAKQVEGLGNITFPVAYPDSDLNFVNPLNMTTAKGCAGKMVIGYKSGGSSTAKIQAAEAVNCSATLLIQCSPGAPDYCPDGRTFMNARASTTGTAEYVYKSPILQISFADGKPILNAYARYSNLSVNVTVEGTTALTDMDEFQALYDFGYMSIPSANRMSDSYQLNDFYSGRIRYGPISNSTHQNPCVGKRIQNIFCKGGHVYKMRLNKSGLKGTVPDSFNKLRWLETFIVGSNQLTGAFPDLTGMSSLINFEIFENTFTSIPASLSTLTQMQMLVLSANSLQTIPDLSNMRNLEVLVCSRCSLSTIPYLSYSLKFIDLSINNFQVLLTPSFINSSYSVLNTLDIGFNKFYGTLTGSYFGNSPQLKQISLKENNLTGVLPNFQNCPNLQWIEVGGNSFTGEIPINWNQPNLKTVNISNNKITGPFDFRLTSLISFYGDRNLMNPFVDKPPVTPRAWTVYTTGTGWSTVFYLFPPTIVNINLAYNKIAGAWTSTLFSGLLNDLLKLELQGNKLTSTPTDLWGTTTTKYTYLDLSNNALAGSITDGQPPSSTLTLKFDKNPLLAGVLPYWAAPTSTMIEIDTLSCPILVGALNPLLQIALDPSYYNYSGCVCGRGYYGTAPKCNNIPPIVEVKQNSYSNNLLSDSTYGSKRLMAGVDITWIISSQTNDIKSIKLYITKTKQFDVLSQEYPQFPNKLIMSSQCPYGYSFNFESKNCDCNQGKLFNYLTQTCQVPDQSYPISNTMYQITSNDSTSTSSVYEIVNNFATVNFQSKKTLETHFLLNYTFGYSCPEGYMYYENKANSYLLSARCELLFQNSLGVSYAVYAVSGLFSAIMLFVTYIVVKKRQSLIIKSSSFPFCFVMLLFMTVLSIGGIFYAISPEDFPEVCHFRSWFTAFPLVVILSALLVKADRIRKIFGSKELVVQAISNTQLAKVMGLMLAGETAILLWFSGNKVSVSVLTMGSGSTANQLVHSCSDSSNAWIGVQFAYIALFLFAGIVEAWGVRKVPSAFNEGPHIASTLLSLTVLLVILIPVQFMVSDNPNALIVIRGIGQNLVSIVMAFFLFGPKLYYILEGKENDKNLTSIGSSKSSSDSSSSFSSGSNSQSASNNNIDPSKFVNLLNQISTSLAAHKNGQNNYEGIEKAYETIPKASLGSEISNFRNEVDKIISFIKS